MQACLVQHVVDRTRFALGHGDLFGGFQLPAQSIFLQFVTGHVPRARSQSILTAQAVRNRRGKLIDVILESQVLVLPPSVGVPTGVVTYYRKGHPIAKVTLVNGSASLTLKPRQSLNKPFMVEYSGDSDLTVSSVAERRPHQEVAEDVGAAADRLLQP